jgi:hypothetical protein
MQNKAMGRLNSKKVAGRGKLQKVKPFPAKEKWLEY